MIKCSSLFWKPSDTIHILPVNILKFNSVQRWIEDYSRFNNVFGSVVVVAFQIVFRAEIHANDILSFFKNHFWHQHIKTIQKIQTALNFSKKKNFKFGQTQVQPQSQTGSKSALKKLRGRLTRYKPVSQEKTRLRCCCWQLGLYQTLSPPFFHILRSRFTCLLRLLRSFGLAFASLLQLGLTFTKIDGLLLGILKLKKEIRPINVLLWVWG
jgi:hypothetical protein